MAGLIVAGEKPWLQAVLIVVVVLLFCVFMTPETTRILLQKLPWLGWLMNWPVGAYMIVYRSKGSRVEIVAVTQGARDIPTFLQQRNQ